MPRTAATLMPRPSSPLRKALHVIMLGRLLHWLRCGGTQSTHWFAVTRWWSGGDSNRRSHPTKSVVYRRIRRDLFATANIVVDVRRSSSSVIRTTTARSSTNLLGRIRGDLLRIALSCPLLADVARI